MAERSRTEPDEIALAEHTPPRWVTLGRVVLGAGLLAYVLDKMGPEALERFAATPGWMFPLVAVLPFVGALFEALRLRILLGARGIPLPVCTLFRIALMAAFFNVCVPGVTAGGDILRVWLFTRATGASTAAVIAVLVVDRAVSLMGLLAVILALSVGHGEALSTHGLSPWIPWGCALLALAVVLGAGLAWSPWFGSSRWQRVLERLPFRSWWFTFTEAGRAYRHDGRALGQAWLASLPGHLTLAAMFALAATALVPGVAPGLAAHLSLVGLIANVLPLTPGGLGVGELAFEHLFGALGHSGGAALQLAWRAGMLPAILAGGCLYAIGRRHD